MRDYKDFGKLFIALLGWQVGMSATCTAALECPEWSIIFIFLLEIIFGL